MADGQIETALAELARLQDDDGARGEVFDRASFTMLHRPALGGRLIAKLCATEENAPELGPLTELLASALDAARIARETRKRRGDAFLQAVTDAVELAAGQGRLSPFHRLLLASAWTRNGLPAPASLEISAADMMLADPGPAPQDRVAAEASLEELFRNLIEQTEGDALTLHAALTETFPAMPPALREHVIAWSVGRSEPIHAKLACCWLLDSAAQIRAAAAQALGERAAAGTLSEDIAGKMVILRSWMPQEEARASVDKALKLVMRSGLATGASAKPWTVHSVMATLPDGGGAQSLMIALQSCGSRKTAMLLLKQGHGVKDAYTVPCKSASEQKALISHISQETGAVKVPLSWLEGSLGMALADGLAAGLPPAAGLIEVAELCGLDKLRPEAVTTEALISALPAAERIRGFSAQARGKLINASDGWWDRHEIVRSWFEESDHAHEVLEGRHSPRALDSALWRWLETRRDTWARLVARAADVLSAADHPDTDSFTATAMALLEGRALKKIPVMADVHDQTIKAWLFDDLPPVKAAVRRALARIAGATGFCRASWSSCGAGRFSPCSAASRAIKLMDQQFNQTVAFVRLGQLDGQFKQAGLGFIKPGTAGQSRAAGRQGARAHQPCAAPRSGLCGIASAIRWVPTARTFRSRKARRCHSRGSEIAIPRALCRTLPWCRQSAGRVRARTGRDD